jgi:hypothetical protein
MSDINSMLKMIEQFKNLSEMFGEKESANQGLNDQVGEKVIIRTYSSGVWFGLLDKKSGDEVYLRNARRMWRWHAAESISLSGVAKFGIIQSKSKICPGLNKQWLKAIEIISLEEIAITSLESADDADAE